MLSVSAWARWASTATCSPVFVCRRVKSNVDTAARIATAMKLIATSSSMSEKPSWPLRRAAPVRSEVAAIEPIRERHRVARRADIPGAGGPHLHDDLKELGRRLREHGDLGGQRRVLDVADHRRAAGALS